MTTQQPTLEERIPPRGGGPERTGDQWPTHVAKARRRRQRAREHRDEDSDQ